jgi:hypothetical protein
MDSSCRQTIIKEPGELKNTVEQMDLLDTYSTFYPTAKYTVRSSTWRTCSRMDYISDHKTHLNKFVEIKQHDPEKPMGQKRNQKGILKSS